MEKKIFEYTKKDAYGIELYKMSIYYKDEDNVEYVTYGTSTKTMIETISKDDIEEILSIITDNDDLFNIESIPEPPVLDGYRNSFYFSNLTDFYKINVNNLEYYLYQDLENEDAALLLEVFEDISEILERNDIELSL